MMKLHWSPRSPFVRKVTILLHETGLLHRVEFIRSVVAIAQPNLTLMRDNPLGQLPTLVLDDGRTLFDSSVISEYFDSLHDGKKLFPATGESRWQALRYQALGDNMMSAMVIWRHERMRGNKTLPGWLASFELKMKNAAALLEQEIDDLNMDGFNIAHITIGCALSYLDFRFADFDWRSTTPKLTAWHQEFEKRASVIATEVVDDS